MNHTAARLAHTAEQISELLANSQDRDKILQVVCQLLHDAVDYYNWVGFYLVDPANDRELVLGPFVGAATDHTRIRFGQGICGQAAEAGRTFVVQDVSQESNYLACSLTVQSEIVVPIFKDGCVVGELDIDSHVLAPFTVEDQTGLEKIAAQLAVLF